MAGSLAIVVGPTAALYAMLGLLVVSAVIWCGLVSRGHGRVPEPADRLT